MNATLCTPCNFLAETGANAYDSIHFSGVPHAERLSKPGSRIQAVRHLGVGKSGAARAAGSPETVDTLLINLAAPQRYRGHIGDFHFDKQLQRGHISFIPHGLPTELDFPSDHSAIAFFIPKDDLHLLREEMGAAEPRPFVSERIDRLSQLIMMCTTELQAPGFASEFIVDGLVRAIGATLLRDNAAPAEAVQDHIFLSPVRLARVIDFIDSQLEGEIHLADLAAVAGLSPFHFSRVFKLTTGETPYHFVGSRRLDRARAMLVGSDLPLAELALACGFASQSHFTAAFTKAIGVPPGRYRRHCKS